MKSGSETGLKTLLFVSVLGLFFSLLGCQNTRELSTGLKVMTVDEYENIIDNNSDHKSMYDGLYNTLQLYATLINPTVARAQLDQNARLFLWDKEKFETEAKKAEEDLAKETKVFVSLYTPDRKHDDLNKSKTLWKFFLDVNGKRYEGKATKIKLLVTEIQGLYPYHTRFATPYNLTFPVSAKFIEKENIRLVMTGPVGSVSADFGKLPPPQATTASPQPATAP